MNAAVERDSNQLFWGGATDGHEEIRCTGGKRQEVQGKPSNLCFDESVLYNGLLVGSVTRDQENK